jgi:23S rRNA pseudouridine1911/1915/1917 synthase
MAWASSRSCLPNAARRSLPLQSRLNSLVLPQAAVAGPESQRSPRFEIIAETEDYAVIEKPPFLLVHPTKPDGPRTLWHELRQLLAFELHTGGQISVINRLDRETSGLVLVAKNASTARQFGLAMQANRVGKEYLGIVYGWPEWNRVVVDKPLDRIGKHRESPIWLKRGVIVGGAAARTEFMVERRFQHCEHGRFSVIRALPTTGRTHQIRVHLAETGHPIVGDKIYGPNEQFYLRFIETGWTAELEGELLLPRHALHSARLTIANAGDWQSPLPADLAAFAADAEPSAGVNQ